MGFDKKSVMLLGLIILILVTVLSVLNFSTCIYMPSDYFLTEILQPGQCTVHGYKYCFNF